MWILKIFLSKQKLKTDRARLLSIARSAAAAAAAAARSAATSRVPTEPEFFVFVWPRRRSLSRLKRGAARRIVKCAPGRRHFIFSTCVHAVRTSHRLQHCCPCWRRRRNQYVGITRKWELSKRYMPYKLRNKRAGRIVWYNVSQQIEKYDSSKIILQKV